MNWLIVALFVPVAPSADPKEVRSLVSKTVLFSMAVVACPVRTLSKTLPASFLPPRALWRKSKEKTLPNIILPPFARHLSSSPSERSK
ncbi:hypothetical protein F5Y18DRAFT_423334 [Xylariaceae sp. FL1019]|nr:hypothetical protein F5Y18DRAFT_423334 [Xylariaceae sp. FL1019]